MSKTCELCGLTKTGVYYSEQFDKSLCRKCYNYEKKHPVHPLPEKGEIAYDNEGKLICHICGRAFKKLASHAYNGHKITASEYKKMFGLNNKEGLLIESTKEKLREYSKVNYEIVVKENLLSKGEKTRFKKGCSGRTKDKVRLQCRKVLAQNFFKVKQCD